MASALILKGIFYLFWSALVLEEDQTAMDPQTKLKGDGQQCGESEIRKCLGNALGEFRIQSHTSNILKLVRF